MALTLSVGFVVDDAIVMLENIARHMEMGKAPLQATLDGAARNRLHDRLDDALARRRVHPGHVHGRHHRAGCCTSSPSRSSCAVLVSGFVSLSLTPMLASRMLKARGEEKHGPAVSAQRALVQRVAQRLCAQPELVHGAPAPGAPDLRRDHGGHRDAVRARAEGLPAERRLRAVVRVHGGGAGHRLRCDGRASSAPRPRSSSADPNVESVASFIGASGSSPTLNLGRMLISCKPYSERLPADEVHPAAPSEAGRHSGLQRLSAERAVDPLRRTAHEEPVSVHAAWAETPGELFDWAPKVTAALAALPGFQDVTSDLQIASPQLDVHVDRGAAAAVGLTVQQVEDGLYTAFGPRQVSTIYTPNDQYWVLMQVDPHFQSDPKVLDQLHLRSNTGALVPLSAVASVNRSVGPRTISHLGQVPAVTISFSLAPNVRAEPGRDGASTRR